MGKDEKVMKRGEAAQYLRIPERTLNYLIATNQIPYSRVGRKNVRFRKSRLDQYLSDRENIPYRRGESSE